MEIVGAGTAAINGYYKWDEEYIQNGHVHYTKCYNDTADVCADSRPSGAPAAYQIYFGAGGWQIYGPGDVDYYKALETPSMPPTSGWTAACMGGCHGLPPQPTLQYLESFVSPVGDEISGSDVPSGTLVGQQQNGLGLRFSSLNDRNNDPSSSINDPSHLSSFIFEYSCTDITDIGCTNQNAPNFNPSATIDDGSCITACHNGPLPLPATDAHTVLDFTGGYQSNEDCGWRIDCAISEDLAVLRFTSFDTEYNYDFVELTNVRAVPSQPSLPNGAMASSSGHLSGQDIPPDLFTTQNHTLHVTFHSDNTNEADGFAAEYWCSPFVPGCTDPTAHNFDPAAVIDDGNCTYPDVFEEGAALRGGCLFRVGLSDRMASQSHLSGWRAGNPCAAALAVGWEGVTCRAGHVETVDLSSRAGLGGFKLGAQLGNLTALRSLILFSTELLGTLPPEISRIVGLHRLHLYSTSLSGTLPAQMGNLPELTELQLSETMLSGSLPPALGNLRELIILDLSATRLSGTLPLDLTGRKKPCDFEIKDFILGPAPSTSAEMLAGQPVFQNGQPDPQLKIGDHVMNTKFGSGVVVEWGACTEDAENILASAGGSCEDAAVYAPGGCEYDLQTFGLPGEALRDICPVTCGICGPHFGGYCRIVFDDGKGATDGLIVDTSSVTFYKDTIPPKNGTLDTCQATCCSKASCIGFVRSRSSEDIGTCWFKTAAVASERTYEPAFKTIMKASTSITGLTKLTNMLLDKTTLSGTVSSAIGDLINLEQLFVYETKLSGTLPSTICQTSMIQIDAHSCMLTENGTAGLNSSGCRNLRLLDLVNNSLTALPAELPTGLTHLFLGANPIKTTANEFSDLLAGLGQLVGFDGAFLNADVDLGKGMVTPPASCRLGVGAPLCTFSLQLEDSHKQIIRAGGLKPNLIVAARCITYKGPDGFIHRRNCTLREQMVDDGDGSYTVILPADWVSTSGPFTVGFFDGEERVDGSSEFFPLYTAGGTYAGDNHTGAPSLRTAHYAPVICPVGVNTVPSLTGGECVCDDGFVPFKSIKGVCHRACDYTQTVSDDGLTCVCAPGRYNATAVGALVCVLGSSWSAGLVAAHEDEICRTCPTGCTDCDNIPGGLAGRWAGPAIASGWRLNVSNGSSVLGLLASGAGPTPRTQFVFRCPEAAVAACPFIPLGTGLITNTSLPPVSSLECVSPQAGVLCGSCAPTYQLYARRCTACGNSYERIKTDFGLTPAGLVMFATMTAALVGLTTWALRRKLRRVKTALYTNAKILLGLAQVVTLLSGALDLLFPAEARAAINLLALFSADLHRIFRLDCHGVTWYVRWLISVTFLPLVAAMFIFGRWLWQYCRGGEERRADAKHEAATATFFVTMVLYPRVSAKIFTLLRCRHLGPSTGPLAGPAVLEDDYNVDCFAPEYTYYQAAAYFLVLLVPLGVPIGLLVMLLRAGSRHQRAYQALVTAEEDDFRLSQRQTLAGVPPTAVVAAGSSEAYVYGQLYSTFGFCTDDYRPGCYWYEPLDLLRKLSLTSLLQFVARGSGLQVLCGTAVAVGSFAIQLLLWPYRQTESNLLKAAVDIQIFLTFLISFILRALGAGGSGGGLAAYEPLQTEFYGWLLLASIAAVVVLAVILTSWQWMTNRRWKASMASTWKDGPDEGIHLDSIPSTGLLSELLNNDANEQSLPGDGPRHDSSMRVTADFSTSMTSSRRAVSTSGQR
jgi:Leucine-rich repeat (LRR) protein